ncbi:MAG: TerB family tellurite resistance protein [Melioribacter sp.]|uniref:tellurite resistance TerB family protein n=1 Tax=Rosettibacter primus TaxID=3111523 RepID=UPI00247E9D66|nr:TerB family tellurite resistance protein [Melioribacter sp.]
MLSFIKKIFNDKETNDSVNQEQKIQIVTAALFLEIAKSDNHFSKEEYILFRKILKEMFNLNDEQLHELIDIAEERIIKSVSLYEFTDIINNHFNNDEKFELVKNLWKLIYADNVLNKYEEHLIRIISNNLKLNHRDMIAAKMSAKNENES